MTTPTRKARPTPNGSALRPTRDVEPRLTDYAHERATFRLEVPERYNPVLAVVETWADEDPEAPAVLSLDANGDVVLRQSIGELATDTRRAARALLAAGIGKGDRVFIMLPRVPEWYAATLGAMRIGAIPMPGPNMLTSRDIKDRLIRGEAVAAITDAAGAQKVDGTGVSLRAKLSVSTGGPAGDWTDFAAACDRAGDGETPQDPTQAGLLWFDQALLEPYREGLAAGGHDPQEARMAGFVGFIVARDPEAAYARMKPHFTYQWETYTRYATEGTETGLTAMFGGLDESTGIDRLRTDGPPVWPLFDVVTAEEAVRRTRAWLDGLPVVDAFFWDSVAGMPDDLVEEHLELLATEVRPQLTGL